MNQTSDTRPGMKLYVQVSFAGSRLLLDPAAHPGLDAATFHEGVAHWLTERLRRLPDELRLTDRHRMVGLSSLAIGADMIFTRACAELGWPQRVFLPQPREDFLAAGGSNGPDFPPVQASAARVLLASPHVIEEQVASTSPDRQARFEDVNLELVRASDVVVCLLTHDAAAGKRGGTRDFLALVQRWQRPGLEIRVGVGPDGQPRFTEQWHGGAVVADAPDFTPPVLPAPLDRIECASCHFTDPVVYRKTLKDFASAEAARRQNLFKLAALVIVGAHVLATALALRAGQDHNSAALPWLLGVELAFLACGLGYHEWLHRSHASRDWAMARLAAEVARSVISLAGVPRPLRHLFELPMPSSLCTLLNTLNVLHLAGLQAQMASDWKTRRDTYVQDRLRNPRGGQLGYYADKLAGARRWLARARRSFYVGSAGAFVATAVKLCLTLHVWHVSQSAHEIAADGLGFLAVLLPVLAVAALSLAAAFDMEARVQCYQEMFDFLQQQTPRLEAAATENEFATLALETENRLLGETAAWYARRAFTGVA